MAGDKLASEEQTIEKTGGKNEQKIRFSRETPWFL